MITEKKRLALEEKMAAYCEKNRIFGTLRITLRGETVLRRHFGYADLATERPFTERSIFSLYSISKAFCVLGLMKLYDLGLVDLSAHPSHYIPEAKELDARVTLRQMLHHTSGLPDFALNKAFAERHLPGTPERIRAHLKELCKCPQHFAPGSDTMYANVNMILPALIIENLCGLSYTEYMEKEVFSPLGMKTARIDRADLYLPDRVTGYELADGEARPIARAIHWMLGAGDMIGTADDVFALRSAIKDKLLLKESTWREILTPAPINAFGMGCRTEPFYGKKCITHTGGHLGFRTLHKYLPKEDFDLIFLSNSGYGSARADLSDMIHSAFFEDSSNAKNDSIEMDKGYI